ncbi:MAG TPA: hypothetical protein VK449_07680, partial [Anaerolineales bacterium]|nr:hypothetical protein [Anaerolineales bacterium]
RLIGLLVAEPGVWAEWAVTMGATAFLLAVVGLVASPRSGIFWLVLLALGLVLALGRATPVGRLLDLLPGAGLLRVPARWLFLSGMAIAALAARGIDVIGSQAEPAARRRIRMAMIVGGLSIAILSLALAKLSAALLWPSTLFAILTAVAVLASLRWRGGYWAPLLTGLLVVELASIDAHLIEARAEDQALGAGRAVADYLGEHGDGRVFSPSYAVPQEAAAEAGLELADGVHPLQLGDYVAFMSAATGFPPDGYSVTLPPFPSGDPNDDWGPTLDASKLGLLGVDRVASTFPVQAEGLSLEATVDGVRIYRNSAARPRAWVEGGGAVSRIERTPNAIEVHAKGPGRLVLAEVMYPGWRATVDGLAAPIVPYQDILRSVELPAGEHVVRLGFVPASLALGVALTLAAALASVLVWSRS